MKLTTFDQIWQTFLDNCKASDFNLPKTNEQIYAQIKNATMLFNNRMRTKLACDTTAEVLNEELNDDHLLILAHYIRLTFLINEKTHYETLWQPFSSDFGLKNFSTQLKTLENSVAAQKATIETMIMNAEVDFL